MILFLVVNDISGNKTAQDFEFYCVFNQNSQCALTGLVCRVVVLDEEGVSVIPDLLAGSGVVLHNERLKVRVEDAFTRADVNG